MAQHFLLSAKARDMSVHKVLGMNDDEARALFAELRWGDAQHQSCPHCAVVDAHRYVPLQKRWRCRHCYKAFSVTSRTLFNCHKLPLQLILGALLLCANAVKGISALQLARDLDVQYKTAFVLLHKVRETLWKTRETDKFKGEVEIDGGYMHTYVRPKNKKSDRVDLRLAENQNQNKCAILVLRERHPDKKQGARRTRTFILSSENEKDIFAVVNANVERGAKVFTDEAPGYTLLGAHWDHYVVSHSAEYSTQDGVNENQAESYISRFRRLLMGQIHKLERKYLDVYANEIAFREDRRRKSNGRFVRDALARCLRVGPSSDWSKYWQGNKRRHDSVVNYSERAHAPA